jgi:hypothetical protein
MLQNPKRTRKDLSDAWQHSHGYCFAMGLPFVPEFFQCAQFLDADGRKELKALIATYKAHREEIFTSVTFPIGDVPDNASWSGFQMMNPGGKSGHLLIFRELHNEQPRHDMQLKFLNGKTVALENVETGEKRAAKVSATGDVEFEIRQPAGYGFYKYAVE